MVIIDPDSIYRLGMVACLDPLPDIARVVGVATPADAWQQETLASADLVVVSVEFERLEMLIGQLHHRIGCRVMASATRWQQAEVLQAVNAGAVGVMSKDRLTAEALVAQVRAALHGAGVVPPELLSTLMVRDNAYRGSRARDGHLSAREQRVLSLIADGRVTREVAAELSYSERTVKSVLHGAVTKLGARSRSQAIALAVRDGLI